MSALSTPERACPGTDASVSFELARVDGRLARAHHVVRSVRLPKGVQSVVERCVQTVFDQLNPDQAEFGSLIFFGAAKSVEVLSNDKNSQGFVLSDAQARVEWGRRTASVILNTKSHVALNGWPVLPPSTPLSLRDGDVVEIGGATFAVAHVPPVCPADFAIGDWSMCTRPAETSFVYSFDLNPSAGAGCLVLERSTALAVADIALGGDGSRPFDPTLASDIERGIADWVAQRCLNLACVWLFRGTSAPGFRASNMHEIDMWLQATVRVRSFVGTVWLGFSPEALSALAAVQSVRSADCDASLGVLADVMVLTSLLIPSAHVTVSDLSILEQGDVLVTDATVCGDLLGGQFATFEFAGHDAGCAIGRIDVQKDSLDFRIDRIQAHAWRHEMGQAVGGDPTENESFEYALDVVTVPVQIEVARRRLTLTQILNLRRGHVLDFECPAENRVRLVVDGKPIAVGELVDVDGRLGFRVITVGNTR